jgi:DNA-binding transcriptional LysR family regulator
MDQLLSIKAFVTVVRLKSFTKAARQMNVSIASLSRAVSSLESHIQTRLVHRSSRFVSLAPGAREYFDICVDVLDRLYEGEQRLLGDRTASRGVLAIAAHPFAIEAGLPQIISQYQRNEPEVEIVLDTCVDSLRLEHNNYDVAVYPPNLILDPDAICRPLLDSPLVLVASPAYVDRTGIGSSRPDLSGHAILSCQMGQMDMRAGRVLRFERDGNDMTLSPGNVRMSVSESVAIRLVLSGFGIALLPELLAAPHLASGDLRRVFSDHQLICDKASLGVAYMRHATLPHRTRRFVDSCIRFFSHEGSCGMKTSIGLAA